MIQYNLHRFDGDITFGGRRGKSATGPAGTLNDVKAGSVQDIVRTVLRLHGEKFA